MIGFLRFGFLVILLYPFMGNAGKVKIDVQQVGQGNCVLVTFSPDDESSSKQMLVDIGSSSFLTEMALAARDKARGNISAEVEAEAHSSSPMSEQKPGFVPGRAHEKQDSPYEDDEKGKTPTNDESYGDKFIENLRSKLKQKGIFSKTPKSSKISKIHQRSKEKKMPKKPPISIQTVVITHPDKDHYGWLKKMFSEKKDHIEHLIFGGLPENYDESGLMGLKGWINTLVTNGTDVYFLAISHLPIKTMEEVLPHPGRQCAPHWYSSPKSEIKKLAEAFSFGDEFSVDLLSVNPTHIDGTKGVLRLSYPDDDNADSLVLKIAYGKASAILTGDATGITTIRILDNYVEQPNFLQTNVLLASHHGSSLSGSNDEAWIQATKPEIVLIGNGLSQGHPHEQAYKNFRKSSRLMKAVSVVKVERVEKGKKMLSGRHEVFTPDGKTKSTCTVHVTKRAMFSTVTSHGMIVTLNKKGTVDLVTVREGEFELTHLPVEDDEEDEELEAHPKERDGHTVLVSTSQSPSSDEDLAAGSMGKAASFPSSQELKVKKSRKITDEGRVLDEKEDSSEKSEPKRQRMAEEFLEKQSLLPEDKN